MSCVFLDTVGLIAFWDRRDQWHLAATQAYARLVSIDADLGTTPYVLAECANAAARKPYRLDVDLLRIQIEADGQLLQPTDADWQSAWQGYRLGQAGQAGVVDHLSFAVMRRLGLTDAFTNDRRFSGAGFRTRF